jgi:hypothetical protein
MERNDSLYINVLDVPNILAAIDLAEEQLLNGIDYAMSRNVVGEKTDEDTEDEVSLLEEYSVSKAPFGDNRNESTDVYSAGADLVERRKLHRRETNRAALKDSTSAPGKDSAVIMVSDEQAKPDNGGTNIRRGEVEFVGIKKAHGWNRSLQPGRSLLAKREANGEPAEDAHVVNDDDAISGLLEGLPGPQADSGQPAKFAAALAMPKSAITSQPGNSAIKSGTSSVHLEQPSRVAPKPSKVKGRAASKSAGQRATGSNAVTRKVAKPVSRGAAPPITTAESAHQQRLLETEPATLSASARTFEEPMALMRSMQSKNSKAEQRTSDPTQQQLAQMAVPGIMYVPNAKVFGTALPNGYKSTAEGLRPVVTLDPRPKVPHQLRQTMADKLYQSLLSSGVPEMEAIVQSIVTEQR